MNEARNGIAYLSYEGRAIPLRFTWARIDHLGQGGVTSLLAKVDSSEPGDVGALAQLISVASGEVLSVEQLLNDPPPYNEAILAVLQAWALSLHGPRMQPKKVDDARPMHRLKTWSRALFRRLFRQA